MCLEAKCRIEGYLVRFRGSQEEVPIEMNKYFIVKQMFTYYEPNNEDNCSLEGMPGGKDSCTYRRM